MLTNGEVRLVAILNRPPILSLNNGESIARGNGAHEKGRCFLPHAG